MQHHLLPYASVEVNFKNLATHGWINDHTYHHAGSKNQPFNVLFVAAELADDVNGDPLEMFEVDCSFGYFRV